jgi:SRSO17 transposase
MSFVKNFSKHFRSYRHDVSDKARQYACGLMQAGSRKNMDRMAEVVPEAKSRNLQQFLTHSKWDDRAVIDHVASEADALLGDRKKACLLIDESGFEKQGRMSVGTAHQWLGRLGKVDNGQVAVFGALTGGRYAVPVDVRLYLPKEEWTENPKRCAKAGIPEARRSFKTKDKLAIEIVQHACKNDLRFGWVGADAGYGKGPGFCKALDKMGQRFVVDIHSDFHVYLEDPAPYIPQKKTRRGRKFERYRSDAKSLEVREILGNYAFADLPVLKLRQTSRGTLKVRAFCQSVYVWDGVSEQADKWQMVVSQLLGSKPDTKISLTNFPQTTAIKTLAWMQRQRYWVERVFEDAKSECGMADYQVRKWQAWHHHMALVMMAMLFMLTERMRHADTYPLLSCADIEELLAHFLPRRNITKKEIIGQLEHRHRKRSAAIRSHANSSKKSKSINPHN